MNQLIDKQYSDGEQVPKDSKAGNEQVSVHVGKMQIKGVVMATSHGSLPLTPITLNSQSRINVLALPGHNDPP